MIHVSESEFTAVCSAYIPRFRTNSRGQYRGPAFYRDGDNATALSVDVAKRLFFDHVLGIGGDLVRFVEVADYCSFLDACRTISHFIGRNVLGEEQPAARPRFTAAELQRAELFAIGYAWWLSRYLDDLKELWLLDETAVEEGRIYHATQLLHSVRAWSSYQAAEFCKSLDPRIDDSSGSVFMRPKKHNCNLPVRSPGRQRRWWQHERSAN
jgi:hypothetical protein